MKKNFIEALEAQKITDAEPSYFMIMNKKDSIDKATIAKKKKELLAMNPEEIAKLIVNKIKNELSNSPDARKHIDSAKESQDYFDKRRKRNRINKIISISGFRCLLVTDKNDKFVELLVPRSDNIADYLTMNHVVINLLN